MSLVSCNSSNTSGLYSCGTFCSRKFKIFVCLSSHKYRKVLLVNNRLKKVEFKYNRFYGFTCAWCDLYKYFEFSVLIKNQNHCNSLLDDNS